ncbi:MAG: RNA polymerase sigma factor [Bacteroidales bacterium]|nr:RNA polymerase sigma factor [Bacteroidales bacterium]MCF8402610.1 RNA polymerase sigma factor [Bacteroidales bacterium]
MKQDNLDEIVKGCVSGKRKFQERLFNLFSDEMFGVCRYYSKDYTEAEDTLHEGFMKVFQKISQFKGKGSLAGWIRRIMINTALEKFRRQHQMYAVGDDFYFEGDIDPRSVIDDLSAQDLLKLIGELSPQYRMVFNLYAIEGYSHHEIAEMLSISEGTSKSNLARARYVLQKKIKKLFYSSSGMSDIK